ncbi:hypothetical protein [Streptomyces sp. NPDC031705]|uniref:hypothetical protein n=1 Tax=Streptomyces sp. NPDC031705 TaxID=3155729 RepID=UPI0033DE2823
MRNHDENETTERTPLSTEDLAGPDESGGGAVPVYPGEASGDTLSEARRGGQDEGDAPLTGRDDQVADTGGRDDDLGRGRDEELGRSQDDGLGPAGLGDRSTTAGADDGALRGGPAEPGGAGDDQPLVAAADAERYRTAWGEIQGRFVDDPQEAVTSADSLVAELMQDLAGTFNAHKQDLQGQWQLGDQVATEDLRMALQHYRSFFNRLLKT